MTAQDNSNILLEKFVGRTDTFMIKDDQGWRRIKDKLTLPVLVKHVNHGWIVGSYPIYFKKGMYRCKWICIDIDFHNEEAEKKKPEIENLINIVISRSKQFFLCDEKYIIKEESLRGFHIWILLKEDTWLRDVDKYIDAISPNLIRLFGTLEIFPKQNLKTVMSLSERREKGFIGNGVKLPWSKEAKPINITDIYQLDIRNIAKRYNKLISTTGYRKEATPLKLKDRPNIMKATKQKVDVSLRKVYNSSFLRPCIKAILDGQFKLHHVEGSHRMRLATANELLSMGMTPEETAKAFKNQPDYNYEKSLYYCQYSASVQNRKGRDMTFQCETIQKLGYCIQDCHQRGTPKKLHLKKKLPQIIKGWKGLFKKVKELLNKPKEDTYFLIKTTRSGTTTALITQAAIEQKKILVIAPTKRIYTKTILEEVQRVLMEKKRKEIAIRSYRIKSNFETCRRLYENFTQEEIDEINSIFPFLLKPPCETCKYNDNCAYLRFLDNLDTYNVIYMTTQKLKAISQSPESHILLNLLKDWADVVFIDECSHLFSANFQSEEILDSNTNYDFIFECKQAMANYAHYHPHEEDFIKLIFDFLNVVEEKLKNEIIPFKESKFISFDTLRYQSYFHDDTDAWARHFSALFRHFKKTRHKSVKYLLKAFMALSSREVYLQHIIGRNPKNSEPTTYKFLPTEKKMYRKVILASVNDINSLVKWLERISYDKLLIMTDAIKPAINMKKIFKNLKYININDPNKTANKQIIKRHSANDPFHTFSKKEKKSILDLIKKEGGNGVFYVFKNKWVETLFNAINNEKQYTYALMGEENDYFRGDKTIGVKSDLRKMIVFGSPQPPHHSHDFIANIFRKAGYLDQFATDEEAGSYLENYNAQSTFFQAISRVKDPKGKKESTVITYGIPQMKLESYLDLEVAVPEIEEY